MNLRSSSVRNSTWFLLSAFMSLTMTVWLEASHCFSVVCRLPSSLFVNYEFNCCLMTLGDWDIFPSNTQTLAAHQGRSGVCIYRTTSLANGDISFIGPTHPQTHLVADRQNIWILKHFLDSSHTKTIDETYFKSQESIAHWTVKE